MGLSVIIRHLVIKLMYCMNQSFNLMMTQAQKSYYDRQISCFVEVSKKIANSKNRSKNIKRKKNKSKLYVVCLCTVYVVQYLMSLLNAQVMTCQHTC